MAAATITPTEDQTFSALVHWVQTLFALPRTSDQIVKGFQNLTAATTGSYIVISPGVKMHQNTGGRRYVDPGTPGGQQIAERHITYRYQVDCYGPKGPDWASIIDGAWRTLWGVDTMAGGALTPLYTDAPDQLNITNSEGQFEQRFMLRLYGQVNQIVGLPQEFFDDAQLDSLIIADQLP